MIKNMPPQVEGDADQDGVSDKTDRCAKTPVGVNVDQCGCPEDTDNDGVCDYLDKCPDTPEGASVDKNGCWIVKWKRPLFDLNKSTIKPEAYPALKRVLKILKKHPALKVMIKGHTDNTGTKKFNLILSQKRAREVVKYFLNSGINKERLSHKGLGASAPLNSNNTELERAANRRVKIEPVQSFSKK